MGSECHAGLMSESVPGNVAGVLGQCLSMCRGGVPGCWVNVWVCATICC